MDRRGQPRHGKVDGMSGITSTKQVIKSGNSLGVYLTRELKLLGIKEGDNVQIHISTVEGGQ